MVKYAQISPENVVIGMSELSGEVNHPTMIMLDDNSDVNFGYIYDPISQTFTQPPPETPKEPQPTIEEMQAQTLLNTEMLLLQKEIGLQEE